MNSRVWTDFQDSFRETRAHEGTLFALLEELSRLVGPRAESIDPIVKTYVAQVTVAPYVWELTGIPRPSPPRL